MDSQKTFIPVGVRIDPRQHRSRSWHFALLGLSWVGERSAKKD
jgi:hypothetical protein